MFLLIVVLLLATSFAAWRTGKRLRYFLHMFQLEGYKANEYRSWLKKRRRTVLFRLSHKLGLAVLVLGYLGFRYGTAYPTATVMLLLWALAFASSRLYRSERPKKPLAYTDRMKRLTAAAVALTALPLVAAVALWVLAASLIGVWFYLAAFWLADFLAPFTVMAAASVMKPVERRIQEGFKRQARETVAARRDLTVVAITGSYGKTSVKFILAEILRQRFNVLATPGSYNTPMGICIVINQHLKRDHQVLVLEMGARYRGDIEELCAIARPDIAVVTSVGVAHLETMGSIERIAEEKGSLVRLAKPGAAAVLNADNPYVAEMATDAQGPVWRVSVAGNDAEIQARDIHYDEQGARFIVRDDTGDEQEFQTRLLGEHNILNILLGVAVGRQMGLRLRQIAHGVARVQPVEHRLALRQEGLATIIDDAFNSNPVGARNAVDILSQFKTGRRIIVTPGMVELGERQHAENRLLGEHIAPRVDLAILIGERQTAPIQEGLRAAGFPQEKLQIFNSFFDAQAFLRGYLRKGDVVLYENDLPDQYNE